jgi:hypothetical protein
LYSDPLFLRKSGSAGNQTHTTGSVARNSDHYATVAASFQYTLQSRTSPKSLEIYIYINNIIVISTRSSNSCGGGSSNISSSNSSIVVITINPLPESASQLYRPSDCRLSAKLVPFFADRGSNVVRVTDSYDRILYFIDRGSSSSKSGSSDNSSGVGG